MSAHATAESTLTKQDDQNRTIPYTELLASFCSDLKYADIPDDVVARTKLCILDSIGTILAGATTRLGASAYRAGTRFEMAQISTVLGFGMRTSPTGAALVNGTAGGVSAIIILVSSFQPRWQ